MRRLSLRARLALLVLVGVVPFLGFNLGSSYANYRQDRIAADRRMLDTARGIALAIEAELRSRVAVLEGLALSGALARDDMVAFRAEADAVRALQEPGTHILLLRADGQQLLNTALPQGAPLPVRQGLDNLQRVFATNRPSVSEVFRGRVLHQPIVAIEVPVHGPDGGVRLVLSMTPMLDAFNSIIRHQIADQHLRVVILDQTGRQQVARFPADEKLTRPIPSPEFLKVWRPGFEGTTQIAFPGGESRILGFSPVPRFGWTIVVGTSTAQLTAPAWHAAVMTSAVGLALLLVGSLLAQLISRSVSQPIAKLGRLATAAESGDDPKLVGTGLRETDEVAAILLADVRARATAMADQARDAEALKQSNKALAEEIAIRESAEAALLAAAQAAEQASQTKSRFLTSITHELRTPLHGILGYAELLSLEGGLNPTQSGRVATMIAAGEHLLGMINAVLDVSQIEAGRLELHPVRIVLADLAPACLNVIRPAAEAKGLTLTLTAAIPGLVFADATRLRQVLINLLGNAVKFTPGGTVELRLGRAQAGGIRLEVADTGPGIWHRHRDKLFQAFERLNANAVAGIEGTGIGLALAAQLVAAMGGRIGYDDNPGGGSIFWVELPEAHDSPDAPGITATSKPETTPGTRVLVVDDDALNRDIASQFLQLGGHEVVCLDNGAAAVEAAKTEDFDVILMDVRMPGMNGLEATRLIRQIPGARGAVPVIALTAQSFAEQIAICRRAGMDTHVSKPFAQATLLAAVADRRVPAHARPEVFGQRPEIPAVHRAAPDGTGQPGPDGLLGHGMQFGGAAGTIDEPPVFDGAAFADATQLLSPNEVIDYLRSLAARSEALACWLRGPELCARANELAEAAHKVAGAAGMLGFRALADAGRRFEFAADTDGAEMVALAVPLADAITTVVAILRRKLGEMTDVAL